MSKIWVAGHGFDIDARVVRWDEGPGYNATLERCINPSHPCGGGGVLPFSKKTNVNISARRYSTRPALRREGKNPSLRATQAVVRQFILHHDGCRDAAMCFNVLHNERGLSCHFILDNDGTIYQTMDLALMAYHAAAFNTASIGVELCNRGDAAKWPDYYSKKGIRRGVTTCRIHGHVYRAFEFTDPQWEAMKELARALRHALPNIALEYPQDMPGHQSWTVLPNARRFSGYLGHYHTYRGKWDPGPWDFKKFCEETRGSRCFPVFSKSTKGQPAPAIPRLTDDLRSVAEELYSMNESADGGFFPVGPWGERRLWHGGVHMRTEHKAEVLAPFPGRVMAARMGGDTAVGSTNFVLTFHEMSVGAHPARFWMLFYHLHWDRPDGDDAPEWMKSDEYARSAIPGQVVLLDVPVKSGALLGRVGTAGPDAARTAQLHFEVFTDVEFMEDVQKGAWTIIDGVAGGRFCDSGVINDPIDVEAKDGKLSRAELLDFFRTNSERMLTRFYATLNLSEWIGTPDWFEALRVSPDFEDLDDRQLRQLIDEQITPGLWWDKRVAEHARLPRDGVVYHYHPITFVKYINEQILQTEAQGITDGVGDFREDEASEAPEGVTDDIGDESGESFVTAEELAEEDFGHDLTLEDLVNGFPE